MHITLPIETFQFMFVISINFLRVHGIKFGVSLTPADTNLPKIFLLVDKTLTKCSQTFRGSYLPSIGNCTCISYILEIILLYCFIDVIYNVGLGM